jgi:preprotein translocase subunit SecG
MVPVLFGAFLQYVFGISLFTTSVFLILLVLVQRGRGGGLTGALGGMGGQSAFGTKAGDLFTRVTIVVAVIWILLCLSTIWVLGGGTGFAEGRGTRTGTDTPGLTAPEDADGAAGKAKGTANGTGDTAK